MVVNYLANDDHDDLIQSDPTIIETRDGFIANIEDQAAGVNEVDGELLVPVRAQLMESQLRKSKPGGEVWEGLELQETARDQIPGAIAMRANQFALGLHRSLETVVGEADLH